MSYLKKTKAHPRGVLWVLIIVLLVAPPAYAGKLTAASYYIRSPIITGGGGLTTQTNRLRFILGLGAHGRLLASSSYEIGGSLAFFNLLPTATPATYNDGKVYGVGQPTFNWDYQDKDNDLQRKFKFELYKGVFNSLLFNTGEVSSLNHYYQASIPGPIIDNDSYTWRLQVFDGYEWSEWVNAGTGFTLVTIGDQDGDIIPWIKAKTDFLGTEIPAETWQFDDSPYFYWGVPDSITPVQGYSIELNALPNAEINTFDSNYQYPTAGFSEGENTFYVRSVDSAGNWGNAIGLELWVDKTAPGIAIGSPNENQVIDNRLPQISVTISDAASGVSSSSILVYLDGKKVNYSYSPASGTALYLVPPADALANGRHTVWVSAMDNIGLSANPVEWGFEVAAAGFTGSIIANNGADTTDTVSSTVDVYADNGTGATITEMRIRDDATDTGWISYSAGSRSWQLSNDPGKKTIVVNFKLADGTVIPEDFTDDVWLITLFPDTVITAGPSGVIASPDAVFKFEATKPNCEYSYKINGFDWSNWSAETEIEVTEVGTGNHYFQVKSRDADGNIDQTPAIRTWTIGPEEGAPIPEKPIKYWKELGEEE